MAAHLEALRAGVSKEAIRKIWIVGDLKTDQGHWSYHVATLVRGEGGVWYAMDPIFGRPVTAEEWYHRFMASDREGDARIFVTDPSRYTVLNSRPYMPDLNDADTRENRAFKGYFSDLLALFRAESQALTAQVRAANQK
jgi:hypothetical protein